jgi:hypothetical protein
MEIFDRSALTNREVLDSLRNWVGDYTGHISEASQWSNRLLLRHLFYYRAPLLAARVNLGDNSYRKARQFIKCIPLIEVDMSECPCAPLSGCTWLRTKTKVPDSIGKYLSITSIDGGIDYDYRNWDDVRNKFESRNKAIRESGTYSLRDGYIYVHNDIHKEFISVTGVFSDPRQVQQYPGCSGGSDRCLKPLDLEFPFDPEMFPNLFEMVAEKLLRLKSATNADINNNDLPV